jgi:hypothetical protein
VGSGGWVLGAAWVKAVGTVKLTAHYSLEQSLRIYAAKIPLSFTFSTWKNAGFLTLTNVVTYSNQVLKG